MVVIRFSQILCAWLVLFAGPWSAASEGKEKETKRVAKVRELVDAHLAWSAGWTKKDERLVRLMDESGLSDARELMALRTDLLNELRSHVLKPHDGTQGYVPMFMAVIDDASIPVWNAARELVQLNLSWRTLSPADIHRELAQGQSFKQWLAEMIVNKQFGLLTIDAAELGNETEIGWDEYLTYLELLPMYLEDMPYSPLKVLFVGNKATWKLVTSQPRLKEALEGLADSVGMVTLDANRLAGSDRCNFLMTGETVGDNIMRDDPFSSEQLH